MDSSSYTVHLPLFEGPFDLLLFFIERDELNIYDIPIASITTDFLAYIHRLETLNVEIASEFILVAATLMKIKSTMLLPRPQVDENNQEIDPREELIKHLMEYKRYKSVAEFFRQLEEEELKKEKRGNVMKELKSLAVTINVEAELQDTDMFKLMKCFDKVWTRHKERKEDVHHEVIGYPYTVRGQKDMILSRLKQEGRMSFTDFFTKKSTRIELIFNFLAILEMVAGEVLGIQLGDGYNNFWLTKKNHTLK